jgi:hypothetical protein
VAALTTDRRFSGVAAERELQVRSELETDGRTAISTRMAVRLTVCADLFWDAIQATAGEGSLEELDRYAKRFGWLASSALRAWQAVKEQEGKQDPTGLIESIRTGKGDDECET